MFICAVEARIIVLIVQLGTVDERVDKHTEETPVSTAMMHVPCAHATLPASHTFTTLETVKAVFSTSAPPASRAHPTAIWNYRALAKCNDKDRWYACLNERTGCDVNWKISQLTGEKYFRANFVLLRTV